MMKYLYVTASSETHDGQIAYIVYAVIASSSSQILRLHHILFIFRKSLGEFDRQVVVTLVRETDGLNVFIIIHLKQDTRVYSNI